MTRAVEIKLSTLVALGAHVAKLRGPAAELDATCGTGDVARATVALTRTRRVLDQLAATTAGLRAQVIAADGEQLGRAIDSAAELVLRAVTILVGAQFNALVEAIHSDTLHAAGRIRGWFLGQIRNYDVGSFVDSRLERINGIWMRYRRDAASLALASEPRRARHAHAVREAQQELAVIADEPSIAHLLSRGMAAPEWPAVYTACTELAGALRIAGELVPSPWRLPRGGRQDTALEPGPATNEVVR